MDIMSFSEGIESTGESIMSPEAIAEASEKFREMSRKSAQQAKQDKKREKKKRQQEEVLSQIIIRFLKIPRYSGFFLLISRILSKNVPADFILAILALIHKESAKILDAKHIKIKKAPTQSSPFPIEISKPLLSWTTLVFSIASASPHRVLETVLDHNWEMDKNVIQLFSLILKEFFIFKHFSTTFENISHFSETFLQNLVSSLENQIQEQAKLGE